MLFKDISRYLLLPILLEIKAVSAADASTGGVGCAYGSEVGTIDGFGATFYSYPLSGSAAGNTADGSVSTAFFQSSFSEYGLYGSTTGVTLPVVSYDGGAPNAMTSIFGISVTGNHFALELDGYFYAETSGIYTLKLTDVDDYVAVWFGSGLDCCDTSSSDNSIAPDFATGRSLNSNANGGTTYSVYLSAGSYYPIKIRFANVVVGAYLDFSIIDVSENEITNFDGYVYQFVNIDDSCSTIIATLPLATTTVTTDVTHTTSTTELTIYTSNGETITSSIIVIEDPPLSTSTVYTDIQTPLTTTTYTTYISDDKTYTTSVVVVEEPPLTTTTVTTDVAAVTTTTDVSTYISDKKTYTTSVVVVEEPPLTTTTVTTDVSSPTTTTAVTTYTSGGKAVTSSYLLVEEPAMSAKTVTTDVSSPTTTTAVTTYTSGGKAVTSSYLLVEEPLNTLFSLTTSDHHNFWEYSNSTVTSSSWIDQTSFETATVTTEIGCSSKTTNEIILTLHGKTFTTSLVDEVPASSSKTSSSAPSTSSFGSSVTLMVDEEPASSVSEEFAIQTNNNFRSSSAMSNPVVEISRVQTTIPSTSTSIPFSSASPDLYVYEGSGSQIRYSLQLLLSALLLFLF